MNALKRARRLGAAGLLLSIALFSVSPASAGPPFLFLQNGQAVVQGTDPVCTDTAAGSVCTSVLMVVFKGTYIARNTGNPDFPDGVHTGDRVCLEYDYETFDADQNSIAFVYEFGCPHDTGHVSFNGLNGATLTPTTINLVHSETQAVRTVVVAGQWTGTGLTTRSKSHSIDHEEGCLSFFGEDQLKRDATFAGTIGGLAFQPDFAEMSDGRTTSLNHCR